jgi:hypothetical protein
MERVTRGNERTTRVWGHEVLATRAARSAGDEARSEYTAKN